MWIVLDINEKGIGMGTSLDMIINRNRSQKSCKLQGKSNNHVRNKSVKSIESRGISTNLKMDMMNGSSANPRETENYQSVRTKHTH